MTAPRPPLRGDKAMALTGFRLPAELLDKVDRYAARLSEETGIAVSRAEAVRVLLTVALESDAQKRGQKRGPKALKGGRR